MGLLVFLDNSGRRRTFNVPGYDTLQDIRLVMGKCAGVVKMVAGCVNNAAHSLMMDARDKLRGHPSYKANIRNAKVLYGRAFKEWESYEKKLFHSNVRFFHLADMDEKARKRYGDITDKEYYEFWAGTGAHLYVKSRPLVTSLWNKYRVALVHHGVADADTLAWAMATMSALEQTTGMMDATLKDLSQNFNVPRLALDCFFSPFSLQRVKVSWYRALVATNPIAIYDIFDDVEKRNIDLGIEQLCKAWCSAGNMLDSTMDAVSDFDDIFRTEGELKKSIAELCDLKKMNFDGRDEFTTTDGDT